MQKKGLSALKSALLISVVMVVLCGVLYPLLMTGISQMIFPSQANGSLVKVGDKVIGSALLGQDFSDPRFMKGRPSAVGYNVYTVEEKKNGQYTGVASGSQNFAPSNPELLLRMEASLEAFLKANPTVDKADIPMDLLTTSGSGLDPHISPEAAQIQVPALAENTGISEQDLEQIIESRTNRQVLAVFGEPTVNVLLVNLDIAQILQLI